AAAGAANAIKAAAPSRDFFMSGSPLLSLSTSIKQRGLILVASRQCGARIVRNCDTAATAAFCSIGATIFPLETKWSAVLLGSTLAVVGLKARRKGTAHPRAPRRYVGGRRSE